MKRYISLLLALLMPVSCFGLPMGASASTEPQEPDGRDLTQYINMNIGVHGESNTIIGPQRPNASVNPAPDMDGAGLTGYSDGDIQGFSQIHVSGTGVGKYGQFLVSPQTGLTTQLSGSSNHNSQWDSEEATCSEYKVRLSRYDIDCAFTPAEHSTIYKFTYPETAGSGDSPGASLVVDLAHNLANGVKATNVNVSVQVVNGQTVFTGSGYYDGGKGWSFSDGGWGAGHELYFYAVVDKPADTYGVFDADGVHGGQTQLSNSEVKDFVNSLGAYMTFDTHQDETVMMKIGVSFKSVAQAREWLNQEIPQWDYDAVKAETERQWNEELNKIVIDGDISQTDKEMFYTAIYHAHLMPRDRTGDYSQYDDDADMIDDHFAVWDTWRTLYPLYSITNPDLIEKTVNSFIERKEKDGAVRDSFVGGHNMIAQQGGDNIDNILAEAILKGIVTGETAEKAYAVLKDDADHYRLNWQGWNEIRPDANGTAEESYYRALGYIPGDIGNGYQDTSPENVHVSTCSYTLEYAYNDYCTAMAAQLLGKTADYQTYLARSQNWQNLWNPNILYNGYSGFIWPKAQDGTFLSDSVMNSPGAGQSSWSPYFYEASSYDYSFFVPQDVETLMEKMGGEDTFCQRLQDGIDWGCINIGNEPAFLTPYLYAYTSKPYLTTDVVTKLLTRFNTNGVPGNDDSGAMSSWYIFSTIGIFPNAGQNLYFFTSPRYPKTTITLADGTTLTLIANHLSETNCYIQSITINGEPYKSTMFPHDVITNGGEIVFEMGSTPVNYAEKSTAEVTSVAAVSQEAVDLDHIACDEWAHFSSLTQIDRKVDVFDFGLAPEGLLVNGDSQGTGLLFGQYSGFTWCRGKPTAQALQERSYVWSSDKIEIPVTTSGGNVRVGFYVTGIHGRAVLQVYDSDAEKLTETEICPNTGTAGQYQLVTLQLSSGAPETFTVCLQLDPADRNTNGRVGVAAATLQYLESCTVSFDLLGGGALPNQILYQGDSIREPANVQRIGYSFQGWYADEALTQPWDFAKDTVQSSMTLYAKWTALPGVYLESILSPTENTVIDLTEYADWIHFGNQTQGTVSYDRKNLSQEKMAFGDFRNIDSQRQDNERNTNQPFSFVWSDGSPNAVMQEADSYFSWTRDGMELPVTVPAGQQECTLYLSGIRSRGTIEILHADGTAAISQQELWDNTGEERQYRVVTLRFHHETEETYTIRLLVDLTDTQPDNYSMAIAAATLRQSNYQVTTQAGAHGQTVVRGGSTHQVGEPVTVTALPDPGYQFAGWQVLRGGMTLDLPLENPCTFTMPSGNVVLKATFTEHLVSIRSQESVPSLTSVDLSDASHLDWAYLGRSDGMIQKADTESSVFTGAVTADSGTLTDEDMNQTTPDSPCFSWTGGTPVEAGKDVRDIVWSGSGMYFQLSFQPGQYQTELYLSGIRAGAILEVLDAEGTLLLEHKLWNSMRDSRIFQKLTLQFTCDTSREFTVHFRVDPNDIYADWQSVAIFAATVLDGTPHVHDYSQTWSFDDMAHWQECTCGDRTNVEAHTFMQTETDGVRYDVCTVCGFQRESTLLAGDLNGDGKLTVTDVVLLRKAILTQTT